MNPTSIEYLDITWNPTHGCSPCSEGCRNCWARIRAVRLAVAGIKGHDPKAPFRPTCHPDRLSEPVKLKKPKVIGVSFMGDLFHPAIPYEFILNVFNACLSAPWHKYLFLTKRPQLAKDFILWTANQGINLKDLLFMSQCLWFGVTVEDLDGLWRLGEALKLPFQNLWISAEPLLGPYYFSSNSRIKFIACGGESGRINPRPCHSNWVYRLKEQAQTIEALFMFKQWGEYAEPCKVPVDQVRNSPNWYIWRGEEYGDASKRVGKKKAGRLLGGIEYLQRPQA